MIKHVLAAAILALPSKQDRKIKRLEEENRRLERRNWNLEQAVRDWRAVMYADDYGCTCEDGDPCPLCRCEGLIGRRDD